MHTPRLLLSSLIILSYALPLCAQDLPVNGKLTTTSTSPGVVFGGTALGSASPDAGGVGNRMFWHPGKAAFRAGGVDATVNSGTSWDDVNIGQYSFAVGLSSIASGLGSIAMGRYASSRYYSVAIGDYTDARESGLALGYGSKATGYDSCLAVGKGATATNGYSCAVGAFTKTPGWHAQALGYYAEARSNETIAIGANALASNSAATAMGAYTLASGVRSTALGYSTTARGYATTVVGQFNAADAPNATQWIPADPLFIIGNGTGLASDPVSVKNRNAVVVYKNGNMDVSGKITMARQGDILMGEFGN